MLTEFSKGAIQVQGTRKEQKSLRQSPAEVTTHHIPLNSYIIAQLAQNEAALPSVGAWGATARNVPQPQKQNFWVWVTVWERKWWNIAYGKKTMKLKMKYYIEDEAFCARSSGTINEATAGHPARASLLLENFLSQDRAKNRRNQGSRVRSAPWGWKVD